MKIYVDADACPVIPIIVRLAGQYNIQCVLLSDITHEFHYQGVKIQTVDKGADSTDYALVNSLTSGDLVITQDYGLASMCLARKARVLHQDGWEYSVQNIDMLLFQRYEAKKLRSAGARTKGPRKRTKIQDQVFEKSLQKILQGYTSGGSF